MYYLKYKRRTVGRIVGSRKRVGVKSRKIKKIKI